MLVLPKQLLFFFCGLGDLGHGLDRFERMFAHSGLCAEHDRVAAIIDSVGNIRNLGACRAWVLDHALEHLCRRDHGFSVLDARVDYFLLGRGNAFFADLDTEVAARNHDAVDFGQDALDVVGAFLVLYFGNDLDRVFADGALERLDVIGVAHKGMGDEIGVFLLCEFDELFVFFGECWQIHAQTREVDAFAASERAAGPDGADKVVALFLFDVELYRAVVDEDAGVGLQAGDVFVRDVDGCVCGVCRSISERDLLAVFEVGRAVRGAYLRALGVDEHCELLRDFSCLPDHVSGVFWRAMCGVESDTVDTVVVEFFEKGLGAGSISDGRDDFCLFIAHGGCSDIALLYRLCE